MKIVISFISLFIIFLATISCSTEDTGNSVENNEEAVPEEESKSLNGTWLLTTTITPYDKNTGVKGYSQAYYSTYFITENKTEIQGYHCADYISTPSKPVGLEREGTLLQYTDFISEPLEVIELNKTLSRTYEQTYSSDRIVYEEMYTKISNSIDLISGKLQISGPLSADEQNHICLRHSIGENDDLFNYDVSIPFDDDVIFLNIRTTQPLITGTYQYDAFTLDSSPPLALFDVGSSTDEFWNIIGSNCLCPNIADLEITSSEPGPIEGTFSFIGQDSGSYSGNFSFTPYK